YLLLPGFTHHFLHATQGAYIPRLRGPEVIERIPVHVRGHMEMPRPIDGECDTVVAVPSQPALQLMIDPAAASLWSARYGQLPVGIVIADIDLPLVHEHIKPNVVA